MLVQPCCCLSKSPWTWARLALPTPLHGPGVLEQVLIPRKRLGMGPVRETGWCSRQERSPSRMGMGRDACLERSGWGEDVQAGGVERRRVWVTQGSGEP